jgi:mannose-1-phosphate guanylyltransferase
MMAKDGELYALVLDGFWMDIGQPKDYLTGLGLYLNHLRNVEPKYLKEGEEIRGNVIIVIIFFSF